jgi:hypothetical protein
MEKSDNKITPKKTSRLAVCSLISAVIAIISVLLWFNIPDQWDRPIEGFSVRVVPLLTAVLFFHLAFLLGIVAIAVIAFNRSKLKGNWYALLAILLCVPFFLVTAEVSYINRGRAERGKTSRGRRIASTIVEYAKNHNGYLPDANQWCDLLIEYLQKLPKDHLEYDPVRYKFKYDSSKEGVCNYAFNRNVSGSQLGDVPYNTVLVFESKGNWNLSGTEELFKKTTRKRQYVYIYTKDAETEHDYPRAVNIKDAEYKNVVWKPSPVK